MPEEWGAWCRLCRSEAALTEQRTRCKGGTMTPLVWANFPLALLFLLAWVGIPLWIVFKRPDTPADHSSAHAYLAAKAAPAVDTEPDPVLADRMPVMQASGVRAR